MILFYYWTTRTKIQVYWTIYKLSNCLLVKATGYHCPAGYRNCQYLSSSCLSKGNEQTWRKKQVSKCPLVLHSKLLVRAIGQVNFLCPGLYSKWSTYLILYLLFGLCITVMTIVVVVCCSEFFSGLL